MRTTCYSVLTDTTEVVFVRATDSAQAWTLVRAENLNPVAVTVTMDIPKAMRTTWERVVGGPDPLR